MDQIFIKYMSEDTAIRHDNCSQESHSSLTYVLLQILLKLFIIIFLKNTAMFILCFLIHCWHMTNSLFCYTFTSPRLDV